MMETLLIGAICGGGLALAGLIAQSFLKKVTGRMPSSTAVMGGALFLLTVVPFAIIYLGIKSGFFR